MGFDGSMIVAKWDRPLQILTADEVEGGIPPDPVSWTRNDGWQCYMPDGWFWEIPPPVESIAERTGGPVLGAGIARSDYWMLAFVEGGQLRTVGYGSTEERSATSLLQEMTEQWGNPWPAKAAQSLARWAKPFAEVSRTGLYGALANPQLFAERTVSDLMQLLKLVPDEAEPPWWSQAIPDAVYAIEAAQMLRVLTQLTKPDWVSSQPDIVLTYTEDGVGIWSLQAQDWEIAPHAGGPSLLDALVDLLRRDGWTDRAEA